MNFAIYFLFILLFQYTGLYFLSKRWPLLALLGVDTVLGGSLVGGLNHELGDEIDRNGENDSRVFLRGDRAERLRGEIRLKRSSCHS